eukprot:scaffold7227_cov399-Prasinococcus_capsulatus_cf.AAC.3
MALAGSCKHFVNLTNGVEAVPFLQDHSIPFAFLRIQSSQCESQAMEKVMLELDSTLLLSLALGWPCVVWDYGSRNRKNVPLEGVPRAAWYGVEFIRYCLDKLWWESEASTPPPILRVRARAKQCFVCAGQGTIERRLLTPFLWGQGHNVAREFDEKIQRFDKSTKKRIRYYRRWISRGSPPGVLLCAACKSTSNDGDYGYYRYVH